MSQIIINIDNINLQRKIIGKHDFTTQRHNINGKISNSDIDWFALIMDIEIYYDSIRVCVYPSDRFHL